jgi:hypothetical protein
MKPTKLSRIDGSSAHLGAWSMVLTMSTGLYRLLRRRLNRIGHSFGGRREAAGSPHLISALIAPAVALVLLVVAGAWLVMSIDDSESADSSVTRLAGDVTGSTPASQAVDEDGTGPSDGTGRGLIAQPVAAGPSQAAQGESSEGRVGQRQANAAPEAIAQQDRSSPSIEPAAVNALRISSQSWRRGGLGSKALVTFTLRNDNPYAVKDVELACAFSRRDGSHLTDRTRIVPGPVGMKSRKTFAAVHVGFVNVNASKAKCALVAASKI